MAIKVAQSAGGTTALSGTKPDPTPGASGASNWVASAQTVRLPGGGVRAVASGSYTPGYGFIDPASAAGGSRVTISGISSTGEFMYAYLDATSASVRLGVVTGSSYALFVAADHSYAQLFPLINNTFGASLVDVGMQSGSGAVTEIEIDRRVGVVPNNTVRVRCKRGGVDYTGTTAALAGANLLAPGLAGFEINSNSGGQHDFALFTVEDTASAGGTASFDSVSNVSGSSLLLGAISNSAIAPAAKFRLLGQAGAANTAQVSVAWTPGVSSAWIGTAAMTGVPNGTYRWELDVNNGATITSGTSDIVVNVVAIGGSGASGGATAQVTGVDLSLLVSTLRPGQTAIAQVTVTGTGSYNQAVTWTNTGPATFDPVTRVLAAPQTAVAQNTVGTLRATSVSDSTKWDEINYTVLRDEVVTVTAANTGTVYGGGNGVYTSDSSLPAAIIHAGLAVAGQAFQVRITYLGSVAQPPSGPTFVGSLANGIQSVTWPTPFPGMTLAPAAVVTLSVGNPVGSGQSVTVSGNRGIQGDVDVSLIDSVTGAIVATNTVTALGGGAFVATFNGVLPGRSYFARAQVVGAAAVTSTVAAPVRSISGIVQA